ncbi:unnamed protein product [Darwinula stevensoni]|uniref:Ionotropic glutamate receptor C-terminal domain-containing protein n=1 Tax=Darwinula stevensoni TaxID=69355 RepID=A0A7R9A7U3_9CRUS|nr:unnamed protein product [Darwinula stevensoni]CAG0895045.1 unnamed protein product [Darwinula stevensoni]
MGSMCGTVDFWILIAFSNLGHVNGAYQWNGVYSASSRTLFDVLQDFIRVYKPLIIFLPPVYELPDGDMPYPSITYSCKDHDNDAFQDLRINTNDVHLLTFCTSRELRNISRKMNSTNLERVRWKVVSLGVNRTTINTTLTEESRVTLVEFEEDGSLSLRTTMPELRDRGYYFETKGYWRAEAGFNFTDCQIKEQWQLWRCMFYDSLAPLDFQGARLNITANNNPPFIELRGTTPVKGIDFKILETMAKAFNFTSQAIDFSRGYFYQALTFITGAPTEKSRVFVVLQPFPGMIWGLLVAAIVVIAIFIYCITSMELLMTIPRWHWKRSNFIDSLFLSFELLTTLGASMVCKPESHATRLLMGAWLGVALVLTGVYGGLLTAFMSFPGVNKPIETLKELKDAVQASKETWGLLGRGTSQMTLFESSTEGLYKELWDAIKDDQLGHLFSNTEDGIKRVLGGGFAFIHPKMSLMYNINNSGYKNFYMASDQFYFQGSGIALRKGSPYRDKIDEFLIRLQSGGLIDHWALELLPPDVSLLTVLDRSNSDERPIKIEDLQGAFYILLIGYVFAAAAFLLEELVFSYQKRKELLLRMSIMRHDHIDGLEVYELEYTVQYVSMADGKNEFPTKDAERLKSDMVESLRPVIAVSRLLLCFPRLRSDLSGFRSGLVPRLLQGLSSLALASAVAFILGLALVNFFLRNPAQRLQDLFNLLLWLAYVAVSSAFYFVSSFKNGDLIRLIRLHDDYASALFDCGVTISTFKAKLLSIIGVAICVAYYVIFETLLLLENFHQTGSWSPVVFNNDTSSDGRRNHILASVQNGLDHYFLNFYYPLSFAFLVAITFPLTAKMKAFNDLLDRGRLDGRKACVLHEKIVELTKVTNSLTSPIVFFVYAEMVTYTIYLIIGLVTRLHHSPWNIFTLIVQTAKSALVSWVLVRAHRPLHWAFRRLTVEPKSLHLRQLAERCGGRDVALTGAGLFYVTRPFLLSVFEVVCTFTIVRLQMNDQLACAKV